MFGKFLVERGRLREDELIHALEQQQQLRPNLGRICFEQGWLSLDQVIEILEHQRQAETRLRFGAVAVELGYLTPERLERALALQAETHMPLGQVIATLGLLSPEVLDEELRAYLATAGADPGAG